MKTSTFLAALLAQCAYSSSVTKDKDGHCPPLPPQYHGAAIVEEIDLLYQNMTGPNKNGEIRMKAKGCENVACIHNSTIVTCNEAGSDNYQSIGGIAPVVLDMKNMCGYNDHGIQKLGAASDVQSNWNVIIAAGECIPQGQGAFEIAM